MQDSSNFEILRAPYLVESGMLLPFAGGEIPKLAATIVPYRLVTRLPSGSITISGVPLPASSPS
jgi:hypothetical protein